VRHARHFRKQRRLDIAGGCQSAEGLERCCVRRSIPRAPGDEEQTWRIDIHRLAMVKATRRSMERKAVTGQGHWGPLHDRLLLPAIIGAIRPWHIRHNP
jgi:hypothetical protein